MATNYGIRKRWRFPYPRLTDHTCGVYMICHQPSGIKYIGASRNVRMRWRQHVERLRRGLHRCKALQDAWTAAGEDTFVFVMLEYCQPQDLRRREAYYQQVSGPISNTYRTWAGSPEPHSIHL